VLADALLVPPCAAAAALGIPCAFELIFTECGASEVFTVPVKIVR
jgi:hypothetical protein